MSSTAENSSVANVIIGIDDSLLQEMLNQQIPEILFDSTTTNDIDIVDILAVKSGTANVIAEDKSITYSIPIDLQVSKSLAITTAKANGTIHLTFTTDFDITKDWKLKTKTTLKKYNWVKEPKLKVGFMELPIVSVVEQVLANRKDFIGEQIDEIIQKQVDLEKISNEQLLNLKKSIPLFPQYNIALNVLPKSIIYSGLSNISETTFFPFGLEADLQFFFGEMPDVERVPLEAPVYTDKISSKSSLQSQLLIPFEQINFIANDILTGQTFPYENFNIKIEDIKVEKSGEKLHLIVQTSDSFNGTIFLKGIPVYDASTKIISLTAVETDLKGNGFKEKAIALVIGSKLDNILPKFLNYDLNLLIAHINTNFGDYPIQENTFLRTKIKDIDINNIQIKDDLIDFSVQINGRVNLMIKKK